MTIEALLPADWPAVLAIYEEGIDIGTFEELVPTWEEWDQGHLVWPRLVAREDGAVIGWAALAPYSDRSCYRGVAENSIYIARSARGRGIGRTLLGRLCEGADARADLDDPGQHPGRERGLDRAPRRLRVPVRRRPREARPQARRVERRGADGAPLAFGALVRSSHVPGTVPRTRPNRTVFRSRAGRSSAAPARPLDVRGRKRHVPGTVPRTCL